MFPYTTHSPPPDTIPWDQWTTLMDTPPEAEPQMASLKASPQRETNSGMDDGAHSSASSVRQFPGFEWLAGVKDIRETSMPIPEAGDNHFLREHVSPNATIWMPSGSSTPNHQTGQRVHMKKSEGRRKKKTAKAQKKRCNEQRKKNLCEEVATTFRHDALGIDECDSVVWHNPHHKGSQHLPMQTRRLRLFTKTVTNEYVCRYVSPLQLQTGEAAMVCCVRNSSFKNWRRHLITVHGEEERAALRQGDLGDANTVALKDPECPLVQPKTLCTFPDCGWYTESVRADRDWTRHRERCHDYKVPRKKRWLKTV